MGEISSINNKLGKADIILDDVLIRLFIKYHNGICSEIRVWKLPLKRSFWSMFNTKNLVWAIYGDTTKFIHGWFANEGDFLKVLTDKIVKCNNFTELKELLLDLENLVNNGVPSGKLYEQMLNDGGIESD